MLSSGIKPGSLHSAEISKMAGREGSCPFRLSPLGSIPWASARNSPTAATFLNLHPLLWHCPSFLLYLP
jgi:hypothetical protein